MNVTKISIHQLNAAPYNPRVELKPGDAVFDNLKRSIETFGYLQPIIVNRRSGLIHPVGALFSASLARPTFSMISSAVFRQTNGLGSLLCWSM